MKSPPRGRYRCGNPGLVILLASLFILGAGTGFVLCCLLRPAENAAGPEYYMERARVSLVIDGDTIELEDGRRVRYLGIDTPESGEPYYEEATAKNAELVEGKLVELQPGNRDMDEYGRLLRYVYVDGVFVNAELVAQGYAEAYIFDPDDRFSQVLVQLEQYARMRNKGLWGLE